MPRPGIPQAAMIQALRSPRMQPQMGQPHPQMGMPPQMGQPHPQMPPGQPHAGLPGQLNPNFQVK